MTTPTLDFLRDPRLSLPAFGHVLGQQADEKQRVDFYAISEKLQATIVSYYADPPRDEVTNQTLWLVVVGPRQVGKSTMAELCAFPRAAFTPGHDHVCLHPETAVLRPDNSTTPLRDLRAGDLVRTHTGVVAPISRRWDTEAKQVWRVRVQSHSEAVLCSGDHKHFTQDGFKQTRDLIVGDRLGFPLARLGFNPPPDLPALSYPLTHGSSAPQIPEANFALGRILGLYLAEGSVPRHKRGGWVSWVVHTDDVARTVKWLEEAGLGARYNVVQKSAHGSEVLVYSTALARWVLALCGRKTDKRFPPEWRDYPQEFLRGLVTGYLRGDGYSRDSQVVCGSVVPALTYTLRDAVAALWGVWGSVTVLAEHTQGAMRKKAYYKIQWSGDDARRLAGEVGLGEYPHSGAAGWKKRPIVTDTHVWLYIESCEPTGEVVSMIDIEVDHPDHSFCLPQFATSNCIADTRDRADYLHGRLHYLYNSWPEEWRPPRTSAGNRETRQLSFDANVGGKMRTLSMNSNFVGIGQTPQSFHWSEVPFCEDASRQWSMMVAPFRVKDNVRVLLESTPAPGDAPSVEFFKDTYEDGKYRKSRWISAFFPFWDGKLNVRPWPKGAALENAEIRLLEKFQHLGLRKEHLAFRRSAHDDDPEIRRNPELFGCYYPFDDVSCWIAMARGVIRRDLVEWQLDQRDLREWGRDQEYGEYKDPNPAAVYVIGVDPTGYGTRDHASYQVLEVWDGEWEQVAVFAANTGDPEKFTREVLRAATRYNNAMVVVERNGVGVAVLERLKTLGYTNVFFEGLGKPGKYVTPSNVQELLDGLVDQLIPTASGGAPTLLLNDKDTASQMLSYHNDKAIEASPRSEQLRDHKPLRGRRPRHHWDKISALIMAVVGAKVLPQRVRPGRELPNNVLLFSQMTYNEVEAYRKSEEARLNKAKSGRRGYHSVRRS